MQALCFFVFGFYVSSDVLQMFFVLEWLNLGRLLICITIVDDRNGGGTGAVYGDLGRLPMNTICRFGNDRLGIPKSSIKTRSYSTSTIGNDTRFAIDPLLELAAYSFSALKTITLYDIVLSWY